MHKRLSVSRFFVRHNSQLKSKKQAGNTLHLCDCDTWTLQIQSAACAMVIWSAYSLGSLPSVALNAYTDQEKEHFYHQSRCKGTAFFGHMQILSAFLTNINKCHINVKIC